MPEDLTILKMQNVQRRSSKPARRKSEDMDIIKQLEIYRLENRITQQALAKELGVNFSSVSRWLSGKTKPHKIQQYHIEKFLKAKQGAKE